MRIIVHHRDAASWCAALARHLPQATVIDSTQADATVADYLVVWQPPEALLRQQTRLKGIINLGAGVDALLANPALPADVPVVKLRDAGMGPLMADYVRYAVLHFQRNFDCYLAQEASADWQAWPAATKADWPVGVLGLGAIGRHVAQALATDGYPVHAWSRTPKNIDGMHCHHGEAGLAALLPQVRTLVALLPDTAATRGMIDADLLARLPAGASVINPGRGTLIDESALLQALGTRQHPGRLRGAFLDVFAEEPLAADSALWRHPRVRITPHISAPTPVATAASQVADAIQALDAGRPVATVDPLSGY